MATFLTMQFFFSDGWADRTDVIMGLEEAALGKHFVKICPFHPDCRTLFCIAFDKFSL